MVISCMVISCMVISCMVISCMINGNAWSRTQAATRSWNEVGEGGKGRRWGSCCYVTVRNCLEGLLSVVIPAFLSSWLHSSVPQIYMNHRGKSFEGESYLRINEFKSISTTRRSIVNYETL